MFIPQEWIQWGIAAIAFLCLVSYTIGKGAGVKYALEKIEKARDER